MGDHVGDDPGAVARNRERLAQRLGVRPVFLTQVHQTTTLEVDRNSSQGAVADAAVTTQEQVACTIMVADCLPVLMCLQDGSAVGAAHAGWRGLALGVLEKALHALYATQLPGKRTPASVWLGPCIGPDAFEVGDDVRDVFLAGHVQLASFFKPKGNKWLCDLSGLARRRLIDAGVSSSAIFGNDASPAWCTVGNEQRYFSHRRDAARLGASGRMAACIWRT